MIIGKVTVVSAVVAEEEEAFFFFLELLLLLLLIPPSLFSTNVFPNWFLDAAAAAAAAAVVSAMVAEEAVAQFSKHLTTCPLSSTHPTKTVDLPPLHDCGTKPVLFSWDDKDDTEMGGVVVVMDLELSSFLAGVKRFKEPVDEPLPPLLLPCCCFSCCCCSCSCPTPPTTSRDFLFFFVAVKDDKTGVLSIFALAGGGGVDAVVEVVRDGEDGTKDEEADMGDLMLGSFFLVDDDSHVAFRLAWSSLMVLTLLIPRIPSVFSRC